ncbi:MAG: hypothetical protein WKG07_01270 [Hymenobacter sp.]
MILSNLAFGYIAEEVVNVLAGTRRLLGATLRIVAPADRQPGRARDLQSPQRPERRPKPGQAPRNQRGAGAA